MSNSFNSEIEKAKRDAALDNLERTRAFLISEGKKIAIQMAQETGTTTGVRVMQEMLKQEYAPLLDEVDRRFMGAVFGRSKIWVRIGFENKNSHGGLCSIWKLKD